MVRTIMFNKNYHSFHCSISVVGRSPTMQVWTSLVECPLNAISVSISPNVYLTSLLETKKA